MGTIDLIDPNFRIAPFRHCVPYRVHANIAFLSGPARVRLPAGLPSRSLVLAPLSVETGSTEIYRRSSFLFRY